MFVMGEIREQLFFELWPVAAGNNRHLHNAQKTTEQYGHFGIERRLAFGERTIEVKNNQFFHFMFRYSFNFIRQRLHSEVSCSSKTLV